LSPSVSFRDFFLFLFSVSSSCQDNLYKSIPKVKFSPYPPITVSDQ
jgi:hypothetical protein